MGFGSFGDKAQKTSVSAILGSKVMMPVSIESRTDIVKGDVACHWDQTANSVAQNTLSGDHRNPSKRMNHDSGGVVYLLLLGCARTVTLIRELSRRLLALYFLNLLLKHMGLCPSTSYLTPLLLTKRRNSFEGWNSGHSGPGTNDSNPTGSDAHWQAASRCILLLTAF